MNAKQTARLMAAAAPVALAAPPILIIAAVGLGVRWLLSSDTKPGGDHAKPAETLPPSSPAVPSEKAPAETSAPAPAARIAAKRVTREDLAEVLEYGARRFTRKEAVKASEALGFGKTCAYKALSENSKFAS